MGGGGLKEGILRACFVGLISITSAGGLGFEACLGLRVNFAFAFFGSGISGSGTSVTPNVAAN